MTPEPAITPPRRADAERNREKILAAARTAFAETGADVSMAEVSRRAGVGMATLYRNFPGRPELLEALYTGEVDAVCAAAEEVEGATAGERLGAWLRRFAQFFRNKHELATELLKQRDRHDSLFHDNRARIFAAGEPLLAAAQQAGDVRADLTLNQVLDMVIAVSRISSDPAYVEPILQAALDGLRRT